MRITVRLVLAATCVALGACAQTQPRDCTDPSFMGSDNQVLGALAGAALGGLIGSQVGSGSGKKAAVGAGIVAGAMLGNAAGKSMNCEDQRRHARATQDALETQPSGQASTWRNPDAKTSGSVTPTRTWTREDGTRCRDYEQTVTIEGRQETMTGTACRQQDGSWRRKG